MDIKNLSIIRQSFAQAVFTHKVQEVASDFQSKKGDCVKKLNILFVAIVLILLVLQTKYPTTPIFSYLGAGITIGEIVFLIAQLTFSFDQRSVLHKNSALKFMQLRDDYRSLITDVMNQSLETSVIIARRDNLQHSYQVICDLSPLTGEKEYTEAQKRLNKRGAVSGEEFTWSDEEIDRFLPENLRLKE